MEQLIEFASRKRTARAGHRDARKAFPGRRIGDSGHGRPIGTGAESRDRSDRGRVGGSPVARGGHRRTAAARASEVGRSPPERLRADPLSFGLRLGVDARPPVHFRGWHYRSS